MGAERFSRLEEFAGEASFAMWLRNAGQYRQFERNERLISNSEPDETIMLIESGWTARRRIVSDGHVQTTAVNIPGDVIGLCALTEPVTVDTVSALSRVEVRSASAVAARAQLADHPEQIYDIVRWLVADADWVRDALSAVGAEQSAGRLCAFLYQTRRRLVTNGRISPDARTFEVPMTQEQMSQSIGATNVHVNRVLRELRESGIVDLHGGTCQILDWREFERRALGPLS